jgi:hypothetical protein
MPGAWEIARPAVLPIILTRETVTTAWAASYRRIQLPPGSHEPVFLSGMPFDHARNRGVELALEGGFRHVFFVDDDVIMPPEACLRLLENNLPIVSGLYYRRNVPIAPVAIRLSVDEKGQQVSTWVTEFQDGALFECDLVGAGCLLINTDVFRKMPAPWFEWLCDRKDLPKGEQFSEDFSFCRKAKRTHGYKIVVDTRVKCQHAGYGKAGFHCTYDPLTVS